MKKTVGILPLARPTFDVSFAEEKLNGMYDALLSSDYEVVGETQLLMDGAATSAAIEKFEARPPDVLLVLQVTFTDAAVVVDAAKRLSIPFAIWAVPEPRLSGRLRLNSFCGLNLASHALGLVRKEFSWMYVDPAHPNVITNLKKLFEEAADPKPITLPFDKPKRPSSHYRKRISGAKICRIGTHPEGFDTCKYESHSLHELAGVTVDEIEIGQLFDKARAVDKVKKDIVASQLNRQINNVSDLDTDQLDRSLALKVALDEMRNEGEYDAYAIRCWPETFTEYGGAVCGSVSMLGEAQVPCACEADVYGALTQLYLQAIADDPVFLADIVDMDWEDDSGVVWHCGQAPLSMADPDFDIEGTIHTNRKMPLLYQFPLKPGEVTFLRVSQAKGETKLLFGFGEILKRPMAFTGTSGVVRFSLGTQKALDNIMKSGMEHHMALAYGDFRNEILDLAGELNVEALQIG